MIADRIEKQIQLKAPRERVWRALTNEVEFGKWFGVEILEGAFAAGERVKMRSTHPGYENVQFFVTVERVEAPSFFSWRWIPGAEQPPEEATTLVEFRLEESDGGTLFSVTETGFDRLSLEYRAKAYKDNTGGWEYQTKSIQRHLAASE